jgi:hypothetical protein
MNDKKFDSNLSVEVQLAWEVMTCKAMRETYDEQTHPCHYFNRHFGPWLAYDWIHEKPRKPLKPDEIKNIEARTNGNRFTVPALAGGCRKAPIMTIGINPNMPSWQLNEEGSRWCYPYFDNIAEYATYYRYQTIFQEQYDIDFLKGFIDPNAAIVAREDGTVNDISYDDAQENIEIKVSYNERGITIPRQCAILCSKGKNFKKGDIIAGQIKLPVGIPTEVEKKTVGYYQLFEKILDIAESKLKVAGLIPHETALHAGEDVLLGDMVACASPGWTAKSGGVPQEERDKISSVCCSERGWLALQFQQTKPNIVVFSGTSAFTMFKKAFKGISFTPELPKNLVGPYGWLKFTLQNRVMMSVNDSEFKTRIIVAPHFSYPVNFSNCYAFSLDEWQEFQSKWPDAVRLLNASPDGGQVLIGLDNIHANKEDMKDAWDDLRKMLIEPFDMIASIIVEEFQKGTLKFDSQNKHFERTAGPCRFCNNHLFKITEACPYGKDLIPDTIAYQKRIHKNAISMSVGLTNISPC